MSRILFFLSLILLNLNASHAQDNVLWRFKTKDRIYSSPKIEWDIIFFGSGDHSFYAIDKTKGQKIWEFKTGGAIHSSPFISDNLVCFGSADGSLYALDKVNGHIVWKFDSGGEKMYDLWDYYLSSPIGDNNTIFWGCGDGNLYAIEKNTGKLKWNFMTDGIVHASPVMKDNTIFIGSFDGNFYSINKENGSLNWKFKTVGASYFPRGEIQKAALIEEDVVYFGSRDYNVYALDAKKGTGKWNMKQPQGWIIATPIEYKGNIYFGTSDAHLFYCMDKIQGTVKWSIPLNMRVYGSAVSHNDTIYFGTFDGKVIGVDYLTGQRKWEFQTNSSKLNYSNIYDEKGNFKEGFVLYGQDFEDSEELIHQLGSILSTPVIENEIMYFGSSDGNLYAIKLPEHR